MHVVSPAFEQHQEIPKRYTCKGEDLSIPLLFTGIPLGTRSFAIIMDDPDAPRGVFTHWVTWNIPANRTKLEEGERPPNEGKNSYNVIGYRGPCPPPGKPHRYVIRVFALDSMLDLQNGATKEDLEEVMLGHILAEAELIGIFQSKS
ncbi:MAG: YbhB/YbcL family Raf kinase inhibitor-like protein [Parachlamydiaceae bacterium]